MNGNRGAKGSINDRLISMMYRERYKKWELKRKGYRNIAPRQDIKVYLNSMKTFDIDDSMDNLDLTDKLVVEDALKPVNNTEETVTLTDSALTPIQSVMEKSDNLSQKETFTPIDSSKMHELSDKIIEFDPKTEDYDFERYDYYEIIQTKTKVGSVPEEEIIDVEKEININDNEITVIEELEEFINEGKEQLDRIKTEITEVKELINSARTEEEIIHLESRLNQLREQVGILKNKYDKVKKHYDLSEFTILDSITYMDAIIELKDEASVEQLEVMVDICKEEMESIDMVIVENRRGIEARDELSEKKHEIRKRDKDFIEHADKVIDLTEDHQKIAEDTEKQLKALKEIKDHLYDYEIEIVRTTKIVNRTQSLFGSFLRIAAGILTRPLSNINIFGMMLGTNLINKGIRGLRENLNPDVIQVEEQRKKYRDMESEILKNKDYVSSTKMLLSDSLWQLDHLEQEFQTRFAAYTDVIPEYKQVLEQIQKLKKGLSQKEQELNFINKDLDYQYEANKIKIKRAS